MIYETGVELQDTLKECPYYSILRCQWLLIPQNRISKKIE